jgi:hypothetical protein
MSPEPLDGSFIVYDTEKNVYAPSEYGIDDLGGGGSGGGPIIGSGSPEGNRSSPVGTEYIDTARTRGAIKWIKEVGTGVTGWRVSKGDTGWRRITDAGDAGNISDGYVAVRRVNDTLFFSGRGGQWDTISVVTPPAGNTMFQLGDGMQSSNNVYHPLTSGSSPTTFLYIGGPSDQNAVQFRGTGGNYLSFETGGVLAHDNVPWPLELPGVDV